MATRTLAPLPILAGYVPYAVTDHPWDPAGAADDAVIYVPTMPMARPLASRRDPDAEGVQLVAILVCLWAAVGVFGTAAWFCVMASRWLA